MRVFSNSAALQKRWTILPAAAILLVVMNPLNAKSRPANETGRGPKSSNLLSTKSTKKTAKHSKAKAKKVKGQMAPNPDRISEIQSALARDGYYQGDPNGKLDDRTQDALRRFQGAQGLPPSGKLDALTLEKLGLGADTAGVGAPRPPVTATPSPAASNPTARRSSS
jgi:peptidoglycan hydrolase-like protein with peptidoglycan-binding domain